MSRIITHCTSAIYDEQNLSWSHDTSSSLRLVYIPRVTYCTDTLYYNNIFFSRRRRPPKRKHSCLPVVQKIVQSAWVNACRTEASAAERERCLPLHTACGELQAFPVAGHLGGICFCSVILSQQFHSQNHYVSRCHMELRHFVSHVTRHFLLHNNHIHPWTMIMTLLLKESRRLITS